MADVLDFLAFVDASPTPFHAVEEASGRLRAHGFTQIDPRGAWPSGPGRHLVRRAGSLVAWIEPESARPADGFRIVGGHTDSPGLRLKHHHDRPGHPPAMLALEPYGGPILDSWFDRDLGVAGRLVRHDGTSVLVHLTEPWLRVPRLAIHLDRDGAPVDRQRHLDALWRSAPDRFLDRLGAHAGVDAGQVGGFDLMACDVQPSAVLGADHQFVSAPRLDNLTTCWAAVSALAATPDSGRAVVVLFDHEEVGSSSDRGAASPLLDTVLERIVLASGGNRDDLHRALAASILVSGDMAHGVHPNQPEKHEPSHQIALGGGPVLKINQNLRYATDAAGAAFCARICDGAGVPLQRYVHRADLPCGSTIGPISAARTGILTVDVGAPQLAMHSVRELMAVADVDLYRRMLAGVLADTGPIGPLPG